MRFAPAILFLSIPPLFSQSYPGPATVFSNLFGGRSGTDTASALAVDPSGNVAVIGTTTSPDFPVTHAYLPNVPNPPLIAVSQYSVVNPNLGAAVDVTALASTQDGSIVYAASDSGIFRSGDGGVTWTQQLPGLAGAVAIAVDGADSNIVYAGVPTFISSGVYGGLKSTDGGQNWVKLNISPYLAFDEGVLLRCPAQLSGTIYTTAAGFHRSRDGGNTWTDIGPHNYNVFSFALAASDPNVVYTVASDGFVYRSTDGGDTWTAPGGMFTAYPSVNANLYVSSMAVDPQNENTVWALIGTGNLYRSTDGGATFSIVLSDPADQPTVLSLSPSGQNIIAAGGRNAIASYDGGLTWNRLNASGKPVLAEQNTFLLGTSVGTLGFLTKWSADGSRMIFSTFLEFQLGNLYGPGLVASDAAGNTWVAGQTLMKFDPTGDLTFSQSLGALSATAMTMDSSGDVYLVAYPSNGPTTTVCGTAQSLAPTIMKFDPQGNQHFSSAVPQICGTVSSMALDSSGAIYLVGSTYSTSLPTTATAIEPVLPPGSEGAFGFLAVGFLAVLSPQADQVTYLSYVGGDASTVALDTAGDVYVAGDAIHPLPLTTTSAFIGGACGSAGSQSFGFVVKLSLSSPSPAWVDQIGGCEQPTAPSQIAIDANGNVWVGGATSSGSFPTIAPLEVQGTDQSFLAELSPDGSKLLFSSYAPAHFALGPQQTLYLAGSSTPNPPKLNTQTLGLATSAIVKKLDLSATQHAVIDSINTINPPTADVPNQLLGIAPGEMIRIVGRGLGPNATLPAQLDYTGRVATSLGGIQVLINGVPAPLIGVQASVIACMTPFEVSGHTTATVQIVENGIATPAVAVGVKEVAYAPDVLSVANSNGTLNSPSNPAHPGQNVTLYVTGFGGTMPSVPDGSLYQLPLPTPVYAIEAQNVTYAGPAFGLVAGIWQVNVTLPSNAASGTNPLPLNLGSPFYMIGAYFPNATASVWVAP